MKGPEQLPRLFFVPVDLPVVMKFAPLRMMLDKPGNILHRISEKQPDLMRETIILTDPLHQSGDTVLRPDDT